MAKCRLSISQIMVNRTFSAITAVISVLVTAPGPTHADTFPVAIQVHADKPMGEWKPIWRFFGADEPNYATRPDGKKLLGELGQLAPDRVYFRTHNLLNTGDGTPALKWGSTGVYTEDARGNPVYRWTILDRIFDTYRACGIRPYVEIGFMPEALSLKPEPYQHHWTPQAKYGEIFTGWAYPPKSYTKWSELVYQWAKHDVDRYGHNEVTNWYWETWNEANIGYWQGTPPEFFRLHDCAVDAVRRALPEAKVGGPDSAGGGTRFFREFLEHCLHGTNFVTGRIGTPIDFISFHAKGAPVFTNDHVRMGVANQLRDINSAFGIIASYPELKKTPIVIGESDPDGCAACQAPQLGYRNRPVYACYTAECLARELELANQYGVNLEGALTWAFEFEDQPPFAGFRTLASDGIDLPVLNAFRMFSRMDGQQLATESDHTVPLDSILSGGVRGQPDVSALASLESNQLCVLVWHYHDDDIAGPAADVKITLDGLPSKTARARIRHFRIDDHHSDAFTAWQRMGSPLSLSAKQSAELEKAGQLAALTPPEAIRIRNGKAELRLNLPREAVSLLVVSWETPQ
ncbi:MAG TPA: beta-xylosidase [Verrucomicrobiae bacterium]|nr:beta-xylosidase [Verrucomicrobiae bacterium]